MQDWKERVYSIVSNAVRVFASRLLNDHLAEMDDPAGVINRKLNNPLYAALDPEVCYYSALSRSFDSRLGSLIEKQIARPIAAIFFEVHTSVTAPVASMQVQLVERIVNDYADGRRRPCVRDYDPIVTYRPSDDEPQQEKDVDLYLVDRDTGAHYVLQIKAGGELDVTKAKIEKIELLVRLAAVSNIVEPGVQLCARLATAYNPYGSTSDRVPGALSTFFAGEELLIGPRFWNFLCKSDEGYRTVMDAYRANAWRVREALHELKEAYLGSE